MTHTDKGTDEAIHDIMVEPRKSWTRPVLRALYQDMEDIEGLTGTNVEVITGPTS
ncbi:MAG: hypothetical protein AAFX04_08980 [Pseudomonadota bacterium]